ncbi:MAG: YpdA family putative bacillithiol disulfide reductase [Thermoanaerobaculia bacterium]|nr:YpdA family putative bacillithiol disulfide reductase [Thermoanaerobaculia bacterium]
MSKSFSSESGSADLGPAVGRDPADRDSSVRILDLLVIGAGPTGLAVGADAQRAGLSVLLLDRGTLCDAIRQYPTGMQFFTTRDLLEIAGVPLAIPEAKPTRAQALAYYREVARQYRIPIATREEVSSVEAIDDGFLVRSFGRSGERERRARAVVLATGYFGRPHHLGVPGEDLPWVSARYHEAYGHFDDEVVVVGGGNSALEAALELYRWGAKVTLVHRGDKAKPSIKYWLGPDFVNRVEEGAIKARYQSTVEAFEEPGWVRGSGVGGPWRQRCDAVYILIGYRPELELAAALGVTIDPHTSVPAVDPETCESNIPGFYVAGTLQAGNDTGRIFIENSRDHGARIVQHYLASGDASEAVP